MQKPAIATTGERGAASAFQHHSLRVAEAAKMAGPHRPTAFQIMAKPEEAVVCVNQGSYSKVI